MYRFANGISPYLSTSEAFTPNLGTDGTSAARYLKPTTGRQNEAGLKYLSESGNTAINFAVFAIEQRNRIANGSTPGGFEQVGAKISGWELEARQRLGGFELLGNYTSLDAVNDVTGQRLGSVANKVASAWAQYRAAAGWRVGLGSRYIGTVTGNAGAPVLPAVSLFDAMIGYSIGAGDFRFDIKNLTDKQYLS